MTLADEAVAIWRAGLAAVDGQAATRAALERDDAPPPGAVLAVGKAAAPMARAALDHYGPLPCLVVTKTGHGADTPPGARLVEAAHPVPDARSIAAGHALREAVAGMAAGSRLLLLVSGGASALAEVPVAGETLDSIAQRNSAMLAGGLDIAAMNAERRKFSRIKGGGLLAGFRGDSVRVLAISDVPRDDTAVIGSGIGAAPRERSFSYECHIVASNAIARQAAERAARRPVLSNEETLYGDVADLAARIGARLRAMPPGVLILGGEPTVVLPALPGRGGRNQALALALAGEIAGCEGIGIVVGGTDGSDGPTADAGGIVDGGTWSDGAAAALALADSGAFLASRGALLTTGPTGTNVMDLAVAIRA